MTVDRRSYRYRLLEIERLREKVVGMIRKWINLIDYSKPIT
jgi:hypothetical protein